MAYMWKSSFAFREPARMRAATNTRYSNGKWNGASATKAGWSQQIEPHRDCYKTRM